MTMHRFGLEWFRDLCAELRRRIPAQLEILANVGDVTASQLQEFRAAGVTVTGAYHVCRIREGVDSCMTPADRRKTIERILEAGLSWYNMCEPLGPEHTPEELVEQMWLGVDLPCTQHGVMQRFSCSRIAPVPSRASQLVPIGSGCCPRRVGDNRQGECQEHCRQRLQPSRSFQRNQCILSRSRRTGRASHPDRGRTGQRRLHSRTVTTRQRDNHSGLPSHDDCCWVLASDVHRRKAEQVGAGEGL